MKLKKFLSMILVLLIIFNSLPIAVSTSADTVNPYLYSFENYTNGQVLAESPDVSYSSTDTAGIWTEDLFKSSSKDGNNKFFIDSEWAGWGKAIATTEESHTGDYSIKMSPTARFVGYKVEGLIQNTDYILSFYAKTKNTTDNTTATVSTMSVTDANMSCMTKNAENKIVERTVETGTLAKASGTGIDCRDTWSLFTVTFNSKESADVILWVRPVGTGTIIYIDDITLDFAPDMFKPAVNNSALGSVTPENAIECRDGDSITVTATPYPDSFFKGWYVGDVLKSTDTTFTFEYDDSYQGLMAVFEGAPGTIPNPGFEYFQNGQVLASYNNNATPKFNNNPPWKVDTSYKTDVSDIFQVTNTLSHSGEKSAMLNLPYRYVGMDISGLQPDNEYMVSFWAYITGKDPEPDLYHDQNPKAVTNANVLRSGDTYFSQNEAGRWVETPANQRLGQLEAQVDCYNKWSKVDVIFTTPEDTGDVTLWVSFSGYQAKMYLDDFVVGEFVKATSLAAHGGNVETSFESAYVLKGSTVTVAALPFEGNTFVGWYTPQGTEVSKETSYTFTANEDFTLIAKFDGYNKPPIDLFAINGNDGTFENGDVPGWFFYDSTSNDKCSWCSAVVSSKLVYEGAKSLEINARYRNSILPLTGLCPNSDYKLSFYVNQPDTSINARIDSIAVIGSDYKALEEATVVFAQSETICSNSGWNKVELCFNTGANISANLVIRYSSQTFDGTSEKLFIDNLSLYLYDAANCIHAYDSAFDTECNICGYMREITNYVPGDINGDITTNLKDLVLLSRYVAGWDILVVNISALDANGDDKIDLEDVTHLARYLAGWEDYSLSYPPTSSDGWTGDYIIK